MRRPSFNRWIKREILAQANTRSFNLRKLAVRAQADDDKKMLAALLLYAHENERLDRLMSFIYEERVRDEYEDVERKIGTRSIERLALRGTPMRSLPSEYCDYLIAFDEAYHMPEAIADEKARLLSQAREVALKSGFTVTELAELLDVDNANLSAYLMRGETHRVNIDIVRKLAQGDL